MTDSHAAILANVSKLIELLPDEEAYFISLLQLKTIKRKDFLLQVGDVCHYETFVCKGCLRSYYIDDEGAEYNTLFAVEGWWTGDLYSLITNNPSRYFIEALEDTEVLQISKSNLDLLYQNVPKFERFFRLLLQNAYVAQEQRIVQNLSSTAEERYASFLKRYPQLGQRITQKHIASYLGITPEFLSMLRRKTMVK